MIGCNVVCMIVTYPCNQIKSNQIFLFKPNKYIYTYFTNKDILIMVLVTLKDINVAGRGPPSTITNN